MHSIILSAFLLWGAGLLHISSPALIAETPEKGTVEKVMEKKIKIDEPSDITLAPGGNSWFVASDGGHFAEFDLDFNLIRNSDYEGMDCEGIWAENDRLYVVNESPRNFAVFSLPDLKKVSESHIDYGGARNSAFESFTYNQKRKCFVTVTEKNPIWIYELDKDLKKTNEIRWPFAGDVSSATWHDGFIYFLSDVDKRLFKLNPDDYTILKTWEIPVMNPEGLAFDKNGMLVILSDDVQRVYVFKIQ